MRYNIDERRVSKLKIERTKRGILQKTLIEETGIDSVFISMIENRRYCATEKQMEKISDYMGFIVSDLFDEDGLALRCDEEGKKEV